MKKSILYLAASALLLTSCNDMLDKDPRDTFVNNADFWSNANKVTSYSNKFYNNFVGYSQSGNYGWFYFKSLSDDQCNAGFDNWTYVTIPTSSTEWSGDINRGVMGFAQVRQCNYMIDGLNSSSLSASEKAGYLAIARLNRAWTYYQLVRKYGDVQWQSHAVTNPEDEVIYGARTDRDVVMDSVLVDLDYAIAHLGSASDKTKWSKEMAMAMKSDICLYEGTYCKYRTQADNGKAPDNNRATRYLQECQKASEALMSSGKYQLSANYGDIYNSLALGANREIIFYRNYEKDMVMHGIIDYTCSSTIQYGITKDAIDAFLFLDGKPKATTSLDTDDHVVRNAKGNMSIGHLLKNKDKRLSVLIDSVVCYQGHGWARPNLTGQPSGSAEMTSSTGYTIHKYDNLTLETYYRTNTNTGYTDAPLFWYAVVLLNEAEAKAELGTITQGDLDKTINLLNHRAGLPDLTLNPEADPANNMGVSNLLWEIRRCRRCELMTDNWYRYWDLVRWHKLDLLDTNTHPNINRGANLSGVDHSQVTVDANGNMVGHSAVRTYNKKYYFYPIPYNQMQLSTKTSQNPGWEENK